MKVVLDNCIYRKQAAGGISVYWAEISKRIISDPDLDEKIYGGGDSLWQEIEYSLDCRHIFHSSYFRISKNKNAINVLTVHDCIHNKKVSLTKFGFSYYLKRSLRNFGFHLFLKGKLKKADIVICVSESTKQDLKKYYPKQIPSKVKVVHNGVDDSFVHSRQKRDKSLLYVGDRKHDYKNFPLAIKIAKELNYDLVLVGKPLTANERKVVKNLKIKVTVHTNIETASLVRLYNKASYLVYCSDIEGFGIPMIEAAKCRCPVITLDRPFVREVMGGNTIRVSENELENQLQVLVEKGVCEKMLDNAQKLVSEYTWDRAFRIIKAFYLEEH